MNKKPYFPFYPDDYLSSPGVTVCDIEDEGIYIRLLCYAWKHDGCQLPDDMDYIRRLCKGARTTRILSVLQRHFERFEVVSGEFWWRNSRLYVEFCKAHGVSIIRSAVAKSMWNKRKQDAIALQGHMQKGMQNDAIPEPEPKPKDMSCAQNAPDSLPVKVKKKTAPPNPDVAIVCKYLIEAFTKKQGNPPVVDFGAVNRQVKKLLEVDKFTSDDLCNLVDWFLLSPKFLEHPTPRVAVSNDTAQRWKDL